MKILKGKSRITLITIAIIAMAMQIGMMTTEVHATDGVQYIYRSWDSANKKVVTETRSANCVDYNSSMTNLNQGWWYVDGYYEVNNRVNVSGEVNIIIKDGSTLLLKDGIHVPAGSTLNIYNTPGGENGHFQALADTNCCAAIGGNDGEAAGNINIHSGKVTADAYNNNEGEDGAGIGGGNKGNGGNVTIYGGTVAATGANYGAGIGSGDADAEGVHGGTVRIYDGNVNAIGGTDSAGIGGGEGANGGNVEIWGGKVTAKGGSTSGDGGAGIGSGDDDGRASSGGTVRIYGGNVTAMGGCDGAGIGGGDGCNGGIITITGGDKIEATGGDNGAGIGGGEGCDGGNITISGGTISKAQGKEGGAGIGGGDGAAGGTIVISGGNMKAEADSHGNKDEVNPGGAGIGGGDRAPGGSITISGDTTSVESIGGTMAASIGGGRYAAGGTVVINGGTVKAQAMKGGGAGIGTGSYCQVDGETVNVTINGGKVTAIGGHGLSIFGDVYYIYGAAIGAGGDKRGYSGGMVDPFSESCDSYFRGKIVFNGGNVSAYQQGNADLQGGCLGSPTGEAHSVVDGAIEFNGGTVSAYGPTLATATFAEHMCIEDVKATDRNTVLKRSGAYTVKPCDHAGATLVDNKDGSTHKIKDCIYCTMKAQDEPHTYEQPASWAWTDDNTKAAATFKCACGYEETVDATVALKEDAPTKNVATATIGGTSYTDEADRLIYSIATSYAPSPSGASGTIEVAESAKAGSTVSVTVVPGEHCHLSAIALDGNPIAEQDGAYSFTMPKKDVTISALFARDEYRVTLKNHDENVLRTDTLYYGTAYTLPAADTFDVPADKCRFKAWEVKIGTAEPVTKAPGETVAVTANTTVKAVWEDHSWGTPTYEWAEGNKSVTATRTCKRNDKHVETEKVDATSKVTKPATIDAKGETTYTSAAFKNKAFEVQEKTEANIDKVNPTPLSDAIKAAKDTAKGVKVSEDGKDVDPADKYTTPAEKKALDDAIEKAQAVLDNPGSTQQQVDDAAAAVKKAKETYDAAKKPGKKVKQYKVSFDANDGSGNMEAEEIDENTEYTLPESKFTAPEGKCDLEAWEVTIGSNDPVTKQPGDHIKVTDGTTVKAIWKDHKLLKTDKVEPTCTKAGTEAYWTCETCEKMFSDAEGKTEISNPEVISATGHSWDTGKVTKEATKQVEGEKTYTCTVCKATKTESIPKLKPAPGSNPNKKGEDGTAVGKGAMAAAAEKAITTAKNDKDPAGSKCAPLMLKSTKQTKKSVNLTWKKVSGVKTYVIYGNACGKKNKLKKIKTLGASKKTYNAKEAAGKKLKEKTYYKFIIVALDKNKNVVSTSKVIHVSTKGSKKKANPKGVAVKAKVNKDGKKIKKWKITSKITLKAGSTPKKLVKSTKLKAIIKKAKKTKVRKYVRIRFESSNPDVVTVNANGRLTAKKKGTAKIYVVAQNGIAKTVKVTVK